MGISTIVHFSGLFTPNNLVLRRSLLLMLNTVLFIFASWTSSANQDPEIRFLRWLQVTTLISYGSFLISEVLILVASDTCDPLPLVGKRITPPAKPDSWRLAFWYPVMIWEIIQLSLSFLVLTELVVNHFLFARNLVCIGSYVILFLYH